MPKLAHLAQIHTAFYFKDAKIWSKKIILNRNLLTEHHSPWNPNETETPEKNRNIWDHIFKFNTEELQWFLQKYLRQRSIMTRNLCPIWKMQTQKPWKTANLLSCSLHFPSAVPFQSHYVWNIKVFLPLLVNLNCRLSPPATSQRRNLLLNSCLYSPLPAPLQPCQYKVSFLILKGNKKTGKK